MMRKVASFLVLMIATGCSSSKSQERVVPPLQITYQKPEPPPKPTKGGAFPLPADGKEKMSDMERKAMELLGLPHGGVCLTIEKAKKVSELRVYAERTHAEALFNYQVGQVSNQLVANQLHRDSSTINSIKKERNSWWYKNQNTVFLLGGFFLGSATTVLVVYGLNSSVD